MYMHMHVYMDICMRIHDFHVLLTEYFRLLMCLTRTYLHMQQKCNFYAFQKTTKLVVFDWFPIFTFFAVWFWCNCARGSVTLSHILSNAKSWTDWGYEYLGWRRRQASIGCKQPQQQKRVTKRRSKNKKKRKTENGDQRACSLIQTHLHRM